MHGKLPQRHAAFMPGGMRLTWPVVTTYTLRKGSPAKTRTDLVVIGVAKTRKGDLVACPGAEDVASEYGRRFKPMLSSMGFRGESNEVLRVPTAGAIKAGQLLVIGLGYRDSLTLERVRRAAGVAARNLGNAASVALALPAHDAAHVQAVAEGFLLGGYTFKHYKSRSDDAGVADVSLLSDAARRQDAITALENAQVLAGVVNRARDWVNTPPNDLTPELFADDVLRLRQAARGAREVQAADRGPRTGRAGRPRLRRDRRRREGIGEPPEARQDDLGARGRAGQRGLRRQGRHL